MSKKQVAADKMFEQVGIPDDNYLAQLGVVLAAPEAVAESMGIGATVRLTAQLCGKITKNELRFLLTEPTPLALGANMRDEVAAVSRENVSEV